MKLAFNAQHPRGFLWRGRWHWVKLICNTWSVDTDWWAEPIQRDYYKLYTWDKLLCVVYLEAGQWYLERVMD